MWQPRKESQVPDDVSRKDVGINVWFRPQVMRNNGQERRSYDQKENDAYRVETCRQVIYENIRDNLVYGMPSRQEAVLDPEHVIPLSARHAASLKPFCYVPGEK